MESLEIKKQNEKKGNQKVIRGSSGRFFGE